MKKRQPCTHIRRRHVTFASHTTYSMVIIGCSRRLIFSDRFSCFRFCTLINHSCARNLSKRLSPRCPKSPHSVWEHVPVMAEKIVTISLPEELLRSIDRVTGRRGPSRATLILKACEEYVRNVEDRR